ncbi:MAG: tRNA lysidine(34) synthetase TilS [Candidatus Omnitrophica bacterium]|nr:tRNA lysidine(34) synthetase TilS [Candidatus Omnitrophota bacterium]MBU0878080.1 tRNA lysidine(34) synthetase TilS [Candidatus Omnitrophota bacterium]MBU0896940.1 tRNA lysidine(34) synthetase TilS [Candidatus Omnitrophota bacterium]MBU1134656.1 tRNA lysidine(34) synthetase TilS [Candidatus Omnitrophota bacterium]MBU1809940.1 tRNA lysidine(34) synthetase TilS [Candidatus Omnitrophota bacterium]
MEQNFRKTIEDYGLLNKRDRVILGVSGGPDSIFMLHQFLRIKDEYKLQLVCAHLNHSLRKEADKEEDFVRGVCRDLGMRFISEKKDVKKLFKGNSLEQTARNFRFDFFLKCSRETKIKKLALAHHKDDLAETILMKLIRGTGLSGLRGFLPQSKFKSLTVIRPLIELRKKKITDYLAKEKITYCIDKSNFQEIFFRNKIRCRLMPLLEELNPNITDNLYNLASSVCLDYDFIHTFSYREFQSLRKEEKFGGLKLDLQGLVKLSPSILNNVLRIAIEEVKGDTRRIESKHLKELRDLILNRPQTSIVDLPSLLVKKEGKFLCFDTHLHG